MDPIPGSWPACVTARNRGHSRTAALRNAQWYSDIDNDIDRENFILEKKYVQNYYSPCQKMLRQHIIE